MRILILALSLAHVAAAADWQTGQLVDVTTQRVLAGTSENPYGPFPSTSVHYSAAVSYLIRGGDREYTVSVQGSNRPILRYRPPHVVVNTAIRFRLDKQKFVFLDDDGREYKAWVQREALIKP